MASPPSKALHSRRVRLALIVLMALWALLYLPAASVSAPPAKTPVISGFSPTSGPVGTTVTINGQWFQKTSTVAFNGASASFTVGGSTQISATVPAGATSGPITVTTPAGSATSGAGFSVTIPPAPPTISGFSPTSGPVRTAVTISGSNFTATSSVAFNGTSAGYTVVSSSQISATVPTGATSGPIGVTTPGGSTTSSTSFTVINPPTISGFNPTSGPAGATVTITGTNFTGATSVAFNGSGATYTVTSNTQISATVPSGATSGPITVTTPGGSTTSSGSFTVTQSPTISGFNPTSGPVGANVTISGTNLSTTSSVSFNGSSATYTVTSNTQITATVPSGAASGPITVTTPDGTAISSGSFTVLNPPTINGFNPMSGPVGTAVTINGSNLTGTSSVFFNGTSAGYTVTSDTQISATVPTGAATGPITVTTADGSATSPGGFTIINPPTISGFNPTSGPVGNTVTITGTNLNATSSVSFNGTSAAYTITSDTQLTATVPSGATSGPITVTNPAGSTTSSGSFAVTNPPPPPTISGFDPTSGPVGATVTITGTNLNGATSVAFNGTGANYTITSNTQITATVPAGAITGPITVTTPGGTTTSSTSFTVVNPPTISGFNPTSGPVGSTVTITGTNLNGATSVTFNGTGANYTITSNTQITATVPTGAITGPITVTTPGGTTTSSTSFTVTTATASFAVFVGYYDTHHPDNTKPKPNPWLFSPNVVFVGVNDAGNTTTLGDWDSSAVRIDNLSGAPLTVHVTVDIPVAYPGSSPSNHHFDLWGTRTIPAGQSLILAQTAFENFDGSDYNSRAGQYGQDPSLCTNPNDISTGIPVVHVTVGTTTTNFSDTGQILNTHGVDGAGCLPPVASPTRDDESSAWRSIS